MFDDIIKLEIKKTLFDLQSSKIDKQTASLNFDKLFNKVKLEGPKGTKRKMKTEVYRVRKRLHL